MARYFRFRYFASPWPPPQAAVAGDLDDFLKALVATLKADATITGIVGTRIYPEHQPASAALQSSLLYEILTEGHSYSLQGAAGLTLITVRLTVQSLDFNDCSLIRKRLRTWFDGFRGMIGTNQVAFTTIRDVRDDYRDPIPGVDQGTYFRRIDLKFKVRESLPTNR